MEKVDCNGKKLRPLTLLQQKFCQNLLKGMNQYQAYVAAGYKEKTRDIARVCASELIRKPNVAIKIAELRNNLAVEAAWDAGKLIKEFEGLYLTALGRKKLNNYSGKKLEIQTVDITEARKALENIAKLVGAYKQTDGDNLILNNFLLQFQNRHGIIEAK